MRFRWEGEFSQLPSVRLPLLLGAAPRYLCLRRTLRFSEGHDIGLIRRWRRSFSRCLIQLGKTCVREFWRSKPLSIRVAGEPTCNSVSSTRAHRSPIDQLALLSSCCDGRTAIDGNRTMPPTSDGLAFLMLPSTDDLVHKP